MDTELTAPGMSRSPAAVKANGIAFTERVASVVREADYRRAIPGSQAFEDIRRLRYDSYVRSGMMEPDGSGGLDDAHDGAPNSYTFGIYFDGMIASTLRLHLLTKETPRSPAAGVFAEELMPRVASGETFIDPSRFAADHDLALKLKVLPFVTLRLAVAAGEHFDVDYCLSVVKEGHSSFYRKVFRSEITGGPRRFPGITHPVYLLQSSRDDNEEHTYTKFPFFRTTAEERERMFTSRV